MFSPVSPVLGREVSVSILWNDQVGVSIHYTQFLFPLPSFHCLMSGSVWGNSLQIRCFFLKCSLKWSLIFHMHKHDAVLLIRTQHHKTEKLKILSYIFLKKASKLAIVMFKEICNQLFKSVTHAAILAA